MEASVADARADGSRERGQRHGSCEPARERWL